MATRSPKSAPQCIVTIDYQDYALPLDKGLQLVAIMQQAKRCSVGYTGKRLEKMAWTLPDPVPIELVAVPPGNVKPKPAEPADAGSGDF